MVAPCSTLSIAVRGFVGVLISAIMSSDDVLISKYFPCSIDGTKQGSK